ncbi:MAG TPA: SCP2 sterol-binding domain-containing protein [Acidimicrobiia bacterium]|nr:SCP2 sterol-binding domain-containing protein [Acidimicrobiia bacterium]
MPEFLSADWIDALDAAAREATFPGAAGKVALTVEQVVRDGPDGEARYHLRLEAGHARVLPGSAEEPDLKLFTDYDIAVQLHRGEITAQDALAAGRLKVQGRFQRLREMSDALAALEDVFAPVRGITTYR